MENGHWNLFFNACQFRDQLCVHVVHINVVAYTLHDKVKRSTLTFVLTLLMAYKRRTAQNCFWYETNLG